jgi:hypothetical protein
MRDIEKSDIIGARIVDIHYPYELIGGWLDATNIYYTAALDRDHGFHYPWEGTIVSDDGSQAYNIMACFRKPAKQDN